MSDYVINMEGPKKKLRNLSDHVPTSSHDLLLPFGEYLAERLNWFLLPENFVNGCLGAIRELREDRHGRTGEPIRNSLVGHPPFTYLVLERKIPLIAEAIFEKPFSTWVIDHYHELNPGRKHYRA